MGTMKRNVFEVENILRVLVPQYRLRIAVAIPENAVLPGILRSVSELGAKELVAVNWYGLLAPANTPEPIADRLFQAFSAAANDPAVKAKLAEIGIEPMTLPGEVGQAPTVARGEFQKFITPPGQTLISPETLSDLKLAEGARPAANNGMQLPPLQQQANLVPDVLVVDIGIAQQILNMPGQVTRLLLGKAKGKRAALSDVAGDRLRLIEPDAETDLERLTDSFHLNLTAFGLLSFFVGLFIVNSAVGLAFEQRLPMLRTLRSCGVSARMLNAVLVIEQIALALVAGLAGLVCGYFVAAALLPDVAASLRGLYGASIPGELTLKSQWWLAGIAISVLGALAASAASLIKAVRLPVLASAQPQAWRQAQRRWLQWQGMAAIAIFAAAAGILWLGDSLLAGFAVLAALMLGAALALPPILERVLAFEGVVEFGDVSVVLTAGVFLTGFLLTGTMADYKESEKLPGELATTLETIEEFLVQGSVGRPELNANLHRGVVLKLAKTIVDFLHRRKKVAEVFTQMTSLHVVIQNVEAQGAAAAASRALAEVHNLRKAVTRVNVIRKTGFLPPAYALLETLLGIILLLLLAAKFKSR